MGSQLDLDDVAVTSDLAMQELLEMREEIARLRAEVEALRVDAERYRWLRERGESFQWMNIIVVDIDDFDSFDAAIDAARGKDNG